MNTNLSSSSHRALRLLISPSGGAILPSFSRESFALPRWASWGSRPPYFSWDRRHPRIQDDDGQRRASIKVGWLEHDADGDDMGDSIGDEADFLPPPEPPDLKAARIVAAKELAEVQAVMRSTQHSLFWNRVG